MKYSNQKKKADQKLLEGLAKQAKIKLAKATFDQLIDLKKVIDKNINDLNKQLKETNLTEDQRTKLQNQTAIEEAIKEVINQSIESKARIELTRLSNIENPDEQQLDQIKNTAQELVEAQIALGKSLEDLLEKNATRIAQLNPKDIAERRYLEAIKDAIQKKLSTKQAIKEALETKLSTSETQLETWAKDPKSNRAEGSKLAMNIIEAQIALGESLIELRNKNKESLEEFKILNGPRLYDTSTPEYRRLNEIKKAIRQLLENDLATASKKLQEWAQDPKSNSGEGQDLAMEIIRQKVALGEQSVEEFLTLLKIDNTGESGPNNPENRYIEAIEKAILENNREQLENNKKLLQKWSIEPNRNTYTGLTLSMEIVKDQIMISKALGKTNKEIINEFRKELDNTNTLIKKNPADIYHQTMESALKTMIQALENESASKA